MKRVLLTLALLGTVAMAILAQISISPFPATIEPSKIFIFSGTNLTYQCITRPSGPWNNKSVPATFSWTRAATTLTSIGVATNVGTVTTSTAHGLRVGNLVTVSGATVDLQLNGDYVIATVPTTATFTIATSMVSDATYNESTLAVTTAAPRSTVGIWAIQKFTYDGSDNLIATAWANGAPTYVNICDNAATLNYR